MFCLCPSNKLELPVTFLGIISQFTEGIIPHVTNKIYKADCGFLLGFRKNKQRIHTYPKFLKDLVTNIRIINEIHVSEITNSAFLIHERHFLQQMCVINPNISCTFV